MEIEKVKERLDELSRLKFNLNMIDRWTDEDRKMLRKIDAEKERIKKSVKSRIRELNRQEGSILFNVARLTADELVEVQKIKTEREELTRILEEKF